MNLSGLEKLRILIDRTGRPHFAVAVEAGLSPARLSKILRGRECPSREEIERLARAIKAPPGLVGAPETLAEHERPDAA
jgi:transcriptional regulator with XRE-family HTH domain